MQKQHLFCKETIYNVYWIRFSVLLSIESLHFMSILVNSGPFRSIPVISRTPKVIQMMKGSFEFFKTSNGLTDWYTYTDGLDLGNRGPIKIVQKIALIVPRIMGMAQKIMLKCFINLSLAFGIFIIKLQPRQMLDPFTLPTPIVSDIMNFGQRFFAKRQIVLQ